MDILQNLKHFWASILQTVESGSLLYIHENMFKSQMYAVMNVQGEKKTLQKLAYVKE